MSERTSPSDTPWTDSRQATGTCDGWACCREMERQFNAARAQLPRTARKTWQARPELAGECCGLDGAVEVKTDADNGAVCDGDRARCVKHNRHGYVVERGGQAVIEWNDGE